MLEQAEDVREVKRAVSVQMGLSGLAPAQICECLQVSPQYVSKWKGVYEAEGASALALGYRGSESYLSAAQPGEIAEWLGAHETLTVEAVRDYVEAHYGVRYKSKQSYYTLLEAGGMQQFSFCCSQLESGGISTSRPSSIKSSSAPQLAKHR
jgi:transposase